MVSLRQIITCVCDAHSQIPLASGCTVAQLRMIFVPNYVDVCTPRTPLVYVQPLQFARRPKGTTDAGIDMYSFVRQYRGDNTRKGLIVSLNRIWRLVELAPKFGRRCNKEWTCDTAVELAEKFYLNCFVDKPGYIELY